jgi:GT2 family glycosyltransferase
VISIKHALQTSVSVCMIVRNDAGRLATTIESILNQIDSDFELIIVDNNSTDDSFEQCLKYAESDARIKLSRGQHEGNESLEQVLRRASHQFLSIVRPGDILAPSALKELRQVLESNPQVSITSCGHRALARQGKLIRTLPPLHPNEVIQGSKIIDLLSVDIELSLPPFACTMFRQIEVALRENCELQILRKADFWCQMLKPRLDSLYFGLDRELVDIRFFDYWEEDNIRNESLARLAEFSTLGTIRSSLSLKNKDDQRNFQIDKLGRHLMQSTIRDLPACLRALHEQLRKSTDSEVSGLLDSQFSLFLNRVCRTNHLKNLYNAAEQDFERLNREIAEISEQTNKILESKSWKLGAVISSRIKKS